MTPVPVPPAPDGPPQPARALDFEVVNLLNEVPFMLREYARLLRDVGRLAGAAEADSKANELAKYLGFDLVPR